LVHIQTPVHAALFDLAKHLVVMFLKESIAIAGAIVFESLAAQFRAANLGPDRAVRVVNLRRVRISFSIVYRLPAAFAGD